MIWSPLRLVMATLVLTSSTVMTQPTSPIEALDQANSHLANGDAHKALAVLEEATMTYRNDPSKSPDILRLKGYTLVLLRRDTEAEAVFSHLIRLVPDDVYGTMELAKRLHARGAFEAARQQYRRVQAIQPGHAEAGAGLQRLEKSQENHKALADRILTGERGLLLLSGLAAAILIGCGFLIRRLLIKRESDQRARTASSARS